MREIKFRAWCKLDKILYDWEQVKKEFTLEYFDDRGLIFQQYTVLKDKNGVEIYEGDIVKVISGYGWERISDVVWGLTSKHYGNYPAFSMPEIETELNSFAEVFDSGDYEVEVIGNIYENPELLNG